MPCGNCNWPVKGLGWMVVLHTTDAEYQPHVAYFPCDAEPLAAIYAQHGTPKQWSVAATAVICQCDQGRARLESYKADKDHGNPNANWHNYQDRTGHAVPRDSFTLAYALEGLLRERLKIIWPKGKL